MVRAEHELPPATPTVQNPGEEFWTVAQLTRNHPSAPRPRRPQMPQNPQSNPKIRLILEHTVANRAVFYCVSRDTPGPKSATFGIKNRVRAQRPQCQRPDFIDVEPPAKVPYINSLAEQSMRL
jgi:hypothetical protein